MQPATALCALQFFYGDQGRCLVEFDGNTIAVDFPKEALTFHNLSENMQFTWSIADRNRVLAEDITPLPPPHLSAADRATLERLVAQDKETWALRPGDDALEL